MKRLAASTVVVVGAVALATCLTQASFALGAELSFEWYLAAVACVAWGSGRRSALLSAVLASAVLDFLFLPLRGFSFGMGLTDAVRLLVFLGVAVLVTYLVSARRLAEEERLRRERLLVTVAHQLGTITGALRTWTAELQSERLPSGPREAALQLARTTDAITVLAGDVMDWSDVARDGDQLGW